MTLTAHIKKYLLSFLILVFGGYLLLVFAYSFPTRQISNNVAEAALAFDNEGPYRQLNFGGGSKGVYNFMDSMQLHGNSVQDNFTDAIMLLSAENTNAENVFLAALKVDRISSSGQLPTDTLIALHTGQTQEYETSSYARYWHGYLVFLKPLLSFFSYQQIRYILSLLQLGLVAAVICLLAARGKGLYCVPVVLAYFFLNPAVCSLSLQYTPILVLTMAELFIILLKERRYAEDKRLWLYHFFLVGCLTSYFDLLTYPLVTLGIPVIFLISQYEESWKEGLKELLGSCLLWGTGYLAMWAAKWVLASLFTEKNVLMQAISSISRRISTEAAEVGMSEFSRLGVIKLNLLINKFSLMLILTVFAICLVLGACRRTFRLRGSYIPVALAGLLPFAWYPVLSNHSVIHSWMTFRTLAIFVYALMTIGAMLMDKTGPESRKTPLPAEKVPEKENL